MSNNALFFQRAITQGRPPLAVMGLMGLWEYSPGERAEGYCHKYSSGNSFGFYEADVSFMTTYMQRVDKHMCLIQYSVTRIQIWVSAAKHDANVTSVSCASNMRRFVYICGVV